MRKRTKKIKKAVSSEVKPKVDEETFCFPDYGVAIKATNREEAEKKLLDYLRRK